MRIVHSELGALPGWLSAIGNKIIQGTTVVVPTPAGPVSIDLGNKASVEAARAALTGTRVTTTVARRPSTSPVQQFDETVRSQVPGGWLTIAAVAAAAVFILPKLMRGRR